MLRVDPMGRCGSAPAHRSCSRRLSALGDSSSSGLASVHGLEPAVGIGGVSLDNLEESLLDRLGDRAPAAPADLDAVDRPNRRDLHGRPDEKYFIGHVAVSYTHLTLPTSDLV